MKKEVQIVLIFSVLTCLYTMAILQKQEPVSSTRHLYSGVASWQPPVLKKTTTTAEQDMSLVSPMSSRFFENAGLKGFIRNADNQWCAIFDTPQGDARILEPGVSRGGMTLVSANGRYCRVKFGSVTREFKL
jgi:hypothetical protein